MTHERAPQAEHFEPAEDDDIEALFDKLDEVTTVVIGIAAQIEANDDTSWRRRAIAAKMAYVRSKSMLEKEIRYRERHQLSSLIVEQAKALVSSQFGKEAWTALIKRAELLYSGDDNGTQSTTED
jgi:hypothetical protein